MKKILLTSLLAIIGISGYTQTYEPVKSKHKTYLETVKGLIYTYKDGVITIKNNGNYDLGTVSIIASSKVDSTLFGIALFDDGLKKGETAKTTVYFTAGYGKDTHDLSLKQINQKHLVFSFDKAIRAKP